MCVGERGRVWWEKCVRKECGNMGELSEGMCVCVGEVSRVYDGVLC